MLHTPCPIRPVRAALSADNPPRQPLKTALLLVLSIILCGNAAAQTAQTALTAPLEVATLVAAPSSKPNAFSDDSPVEDWVEVLGLKKLQETENQQNPQNPQDAQDPEDPQDLLPPLPLPPDLWARLRGAMALPEMDGEQIDRIARQFVKSGFALRSLKRAEPFLYLAVEEALAKGYPAEIALLPFIESGFNLRANSTVGAAGAWQFMPVTGREHGLATSRIVDLRRGFVDSTRAALTMLGRLHERYGDWALALAAYNWGPGNVDRAIARNRAAGRATDYASLRMPAETRNYVPSLLAMRAIVTEPERFDIVLPAMENQARLVRVPIRRDMDIALAARLAQMDEAAFRKFNPASNLPVLVAASQREILLPPDNAERFRERLTRYAGVFSSWTVLRLERKESVKALAARLGVKPELIRVRNDIPPGFLLKAGSVVVVPRRAGGQLDIPRALAESAPLTMERELPPSKRIMVTARKGERLAGLARRYQVDVERVKRWNPGLAGLALRPGQRLALELPWKQAVALEAAQAKVTRVAAKVPTKKNKRVA